MLAGLVGRRISRCGSICSRWAKPGAGSASRSKVTDLASGFQPSLGPDGPKSEDAARVGLPRWPAGWHDHLQYHFFFEGLFVQARVFLTPSLEEHSLWIFDHHSGKVVELESSSESMQQGDSKVVTWSFKDRACASAMASVGGVCASAMNLGSLRCK